MVYCSYHTFSSVVHDVGGEIPAKIHIHPKKIMSLRVIFSPTVDPETTSTLLYFSKHVDVLTHLCSPDAPSLRFEYSQDEGSGIDRTPAFQRHNAHEKYPTNTVPISPQSPNFYLFHCTLNLFLHFAHFRIFLLTPMLKFKLSATKLGQLPRKAIA